MEGKQAHRIGTCFRVFGRVIKYAHGGAARDQPHQIVNSTDSALTDFGFGDCVTTATDAGRHSCDVQFGRCQPHEKEPNVLSLDILG